MCQVKRHRIWLSIFLSLIFVMTVLLVFPPTAALDEDKLPPVARFDPSRDVVVLFENVSFDGSSSYDPNDLNLTYYWDFDAQDGFQEESIGIKVEHIFDRVGIFEVTLKVSNGFLSAIHRKEIYVYSGGKVFDPIAVIGTLGSSITDSIEVEKNSPIQLSASESFDPNAEKLHFEWNINNGDNGTGPIFQYTFEQPGTYTISLTATTETGRTDSTIITVNVIESTIEQPEPEAKKSGNGWIVFIIIIIIIIVLALAAGLGYLIYNRRSQEQEENPEITPSRHQKIMERRTIKQTREKAKPSLVELKKKERTLQKELDKEKVDLENEKKNPIFGIKDILSGSNKESKPESSIPIRKPKRIAGKPPVRKPPMRQPPAGPSSRMSNEEELKNELDKETSKLESFLSDILSSSKDNKEEVPMKGAPTKALPPPKVSSQRSVAKPPSRPPPPKPKTVRKVKSPQKDEDLRKELKKIEEDMDKEITSLFKKF